MYNPYSNISNPSTSLSTLVDVSLSSLTSGQLLQYNGINGKWENKTISGTGSVTSVSVATVNGISGSVANPSTTPIITLTLGNITPSSVNASGTITGSNLSGINTGDDKTAITGLLQGNGTSISAALPGSDYEVPLTFSTGLTRSVNIITVNTTQNISTLSNLTSNGFVKTSGSNGTLSVDTNTYLTGNQTITLTGDVTGSGATSITTTIANNAVTNSKIRQSVGLSVLGNSTNTTTNVEDIIGTSDQVLRINSSGTSLGFGAISTNGLNNQAVTYNKIQNLSTNNLLLGRGTPGSGPVEEISLGSGLTLAGNQLSVVESNYPQVNTYNDLPITIGSPPLGSIFIVLTSSGVWLLNRKESGLYRRTGNTGTLADWERLGNWSDIAKDSNFQLVNSSDTSKLGKFDLSTISTNTLRTLSFPDASGTIALTSDFSTTTLQLAYNNSTTPQTITSDSLGAVTYKRGSTSDSDEVLQVENGAGTTTFSVDGNGNVTSNNLLIKTNNLSDLTNPSTARTNLGVASNLITTNRQSSSYSLSLSDQDKLVELNNVSSINLTIPLNSSVAFPIGSQILIAQYGEGQITIVPESTVLIRSNGGKLKLAGQYALATLIKIANDEWYLSGNLVI